ncbi:MAG: HNH endonuclease [Thermodesulfobacteriota bacterium]
MIQLKIIYIIKIIEQDGACGMTRGRKYILLKRAGYKCEYCQKDLKGDSFEVEHVKPGSRNGTDELSNLAVSCSQCNRNKGAATSAVDPISGKHCSLYNPRTMNWGEHFLVRHGEVTGKTDIGRATCALLFRDTSSTISRDLDWLPLQDVKKFPDLYSHFNQMRFLRLRNRFDMLTTELRLLNFYFGLSPQEKHEFNYIKNLLYLEVFLTRAKHQDIIRGIDLAKKMLPQHFHEIERHGKINKILSTLYRQLSTIQVMNNQYRPAIDSLLAAEYYYLAYMRINSDNKKISREEKIAESVKAQLISSKATGKSIGINLSWIIEEELNSLRWDLKMKIVKHLVDICLLTGNLKVGERLYEIVTDYLNTSGYGSSVDIALPIPLRRRWWMLRHLYEARTNLRLLREDIRYWNSIQMFNESRGLINFYLVFKAKDPRNKRINKILEIFKK